MYLCVIQCFVRTGQRILGCNVRRMVSSKNSHFLQIYFFYKKYSEYKINCNKNNYVYSHLISKLSVLLVSYIYACQPSHIGVYNTKLNKKWTYAYLCIYIRHRDHTKHKSAIRNCVGSNHAHVIYLHYDFFQWFAQPFTWIKPTPQQQESPPQLNK